MSERRPLKFVMCVCTGECPGFAKLELWKLINFIRKELDVEYAIVHPQLCADDGDRFWKDFLKEGDKGVTYVIGACDPKMQGKMFKDAFAEKGLEFNKNAFPLDLRNMETSEAMKRVEEAINKLVAQ